MTHTIELSGYNNGDGLVFTINGHTFPDYEDWSVPVGQLQVIRVVNQIGPVHPFHLHGQFFQVLQRDGMPAWEKGWRDTVLLDGLSEVIVATYFENPGTWMYHCHILEHAEWGMMAFVDVVGPDAL